MSKNFLDILEIARENVRVNPSIVNTDSFQAAQNYLEGVIEEAKEVEEEIKEKNEVYLVDELGDIAWDYANLLALLEVRGLITNAQDVLQHSYDKYTERSPAFRAGSEDMWSEIKGKQKESLTVRHKEKYGQ